MTKRRTKDKESKLLDLRLGMGKKEINKSKGEHGLQLYEKLHRKETVSNNIYLSRTSQTINKKKQED